MELPHFIRTGSAPGMRIQTLLNRVEKFKSFVYGEGHIEEQDGGPALVVQVLPRKNASRTVPVATGGAVLTTNARSGASSPAPRGQSWSSSPTGCGG